MTGTLLLFGGRLRAMADRYGLGVRLFDVGFRIHFCGTDPWPKFHVGTYGGRGTRIIRVFPFLLFHDPHPQFRSNVR